MQYQEVVFKAGDEALAQQMAPFAIASFKECWPDKPVNIDWPKLAVLFANGFASMIIARTDAGEITGYQMWEHFGGWMEQGTIVARLRSIYVVPEHRNTANTVKFLQWGVNRQREFRKPTHIMATVDTGNGLDKLLTRMGFAQSSVNYEWIVNDSR